MSIISILKEAETDITSLGGVSTEISTKAKSALSELTAIRDEMATTIETVLGSAKTSLATLKAAAASAEQTVATKI